MMMSSDNPNEATYGRGRMPGDAKPGTPIAPRVADALGTPHSVPNGADYAPQTMRQGDDFDAPGPTIGGRSGDDSDGGEMRTAGTKSLRSGRGGARPAAMGGGTPAQRNQAAKGGSPAGNAAPGFSGPVRGPGQYGAGGRPSSGPRGAGMGSANVRGGRG